MNNTRSNEQHVTFLWVNDIEDLLHRAVVTTVIKLLSRKVTVETGIYLRSRTGIHYIPDLSLAERVISFGSDLVIRVYLNRKPVIYIKELYKQRKLPAIIAIDILSDNPLQICLHKLADRIAGKPSVSNDRILHTHISEFPTLAYPDIRTKYSLITFIITFYKLLSQFLHQGRSAPRSS